VIKSVGFGNYSVTIRSKAVIPAKAHRRQLKAVIAENNENKSVIARHAQACRGNPLIDAWVLDCRGRLRRPRNDDISV